MAKVYGPLYSLGASGKIGDAMVHFKWKGLAVVRQWLKPANPQTEDQGDMRLILGGLGRAGKAAKATSLFRDDAKEFAGTDNTYLSRFVQYIRENLMKDAEAYEAEVTAFLALTIKDDLATAGTGLGLASFDVAYKGTEHAFGPGLMMMELAQYAIAVHAVDPTLFNREPYLTAFADWEAADVDDFVKDLSPVV